MKKLSYTVLGVIIGVALSVSVSVAAEEIQSLLGKKIDGEFPVTVNGQALSVPAGTIEGTSYVPLRAIGEALRMDVTFDPDKGVGLATKSKEELRAETLKYIEEGKKFIETENKRAELQSKIKSLSEENILLGDIIRKYENKLITPRTVTDEEYAAAKTKYEANLATLKELSAQIDAIYK